MLPRWCCILMHAITQHAGTREFHIAAHWHTRTPYRITACCVLLFSVLQVRSSTAQAAEGAAASKAARKEAADASSALAVARREAASADKELAKARAQLEQQAHDHSEVGVSVGVCVLRGCVRGCVGD